MPTRYILVNHARPITEVEAYLYSHTQVVDHMSGSWRQFTLLETTAQENVEWLVHYQADRLQSSGGFGVRVFDTYRGALSTMTAEYEEEAPFRVTYIGGGKWAVIRKEDGIVVGQLWQGITQAWTARDFENHRLLVAGHEEWGGPERPFTIANSLVNW